MRKLKVFKRAVLLTLACWKWWQLIRQGGEALDPVQPAVSPGDDGGVVGVVAEGTLVQALKLGQVLNLNYQLKTETSE